MTSAHSPSEDDPIVTDDTLALSMARKGTLDHRQMLALVERLVARLRAAYSRERSVVWSAYRAGYFLALTEASRGTEPDTNAAENFASAYVNARYPSPSPVSAEERQ